MKASNVWGSVLMLAAVVIVCVEAGAAVEANCQSPQSSCHRSPLKSSTLNQLVHRRRPT